MERITSVQNSKIKEAAALQDAKVRRRTGSFIAEGRKLVSELIACGIMPIRCFVREGTEPPYGLDRCECYSVTDALIKKISVMTTPQDIIAVAKEPCEREFESKDFILALDAIQDPSNMGAILRSAEAFGVRDVVIGEGSCDVYSQKTLRGAMGSVFRLNIHKRTLTDFLRQIKDDGYDVIGTGLDKNYTTVDKLYRYHKKVIVIGNEGNGISDKVRDVCDVGMYIPMSGRNESLNAAVAASIVMWENKRQTDDKNR